MEVKKTMAANLEVTRTTNILIGFISALATLFAAFEYTTRTYVETDVVYSASVFDDNTELVPITQQVFFTTTPPPAAEVPQVAEILDIVENTEDISEEKIETSESSTEALSAPSSNVGHTTIGPPAPSQEVSDEEDVKEVAEYMPSFPGGDKALSQWLTKNLRYPAAASETCAQGRVIVSFIVNKDGTIVEPKVIKSVHPALDKEAMRVVSAMPKWQPGRQNGKSVRVKFSLPVTFRLQ